MSKPKKCFPGFHRWENEGMSGLFAVEFLDRCTRCHWWKRWGLMGGDSWYTLYEPDTFRKERHKKTGATRVVPVKKSDS